MGRLSFFRLGSGRRRRAAWATGLSLVLHGLALSGMALGLKALPPPPEDRAMELRLIPPYEFQLRPAPVRRRPERESAAAHPRATPPSSSETPIVAAPETPRLGSGEAAQPAAGPEALAPSLSGRLGCDDSLGVRLTADQRQACADNLVRLARGVKAFGLDIPERKQAAYDLHVYCREAYRQAGIPPMTEYHDDGAPVTGPSAGLGSVPGRCLGKGK